MQEPNDFVVPESSIPQSIRDSVAKRKKQDQIDNAFTYHSPKGDQPHRYETMREMAKRLAIWIVANTPESREQSLAITNLDQVVFWANASIARNE